MKTAPAPSSTLPLIALTAGVGAALALNPVTQTKVKEVMENTRPKSPDGAHPVKVVLGSPTRPSSRSEADLHPWMLVRWRRARAEYKRLYPNEPQPVLTQTFRNRADQNAAKARGFSQVGWGGSLHNMFPAIAFDIAFTRVGYDRLELFSRFASIAKREGLEWGGDWKFKDRPHFQVPNFYDTDIASGRQPRFPEART